MDGTRPLSGGGAAEPRFPWARWLTGAAVFYTAWTIVSTWPLCRLATTHLQATPGYGWVDLYLHLWTLAWVSHAMLTDPLHVFDANVFHPARLTLAGSDHLLGTLPVAGPVYWLTGNPVAALNAVVLTSFPLAALAAFVLVAATTRSGWAGLMAGLVYAFAPWRARHFVAVQTFSVQYMPLALLALLAYLRRGRAWVLVAGLTALAVQLLVAYYVAYGMLVALAVALGVAAVVERPIVWRRWLALGAGLAVVLGLVAVVSLPYVVRREGGTIAAYGGALGTAFLTEWLVDGLVRRSEVVYLGVVPLGLAVVGCLPGARFRRGVRALFLAIAVAGWVLCLGSHAEIGGVRVPLPYAWLAAVVPGFASMRVAMRFFTLVLLGVGGLAGIGLARVHARLGAGIGAIAAAALVVVTLTEYRPLAWPVPVQSLETGADVPPVYRWLETHGQGGALVELPVAAEGSLLTSYREGRAMYFSTYHWLPLLDGYTAYRPRSHGVVMRLARRLPEPESLQALVNLTDLRWVLVHLGTLSAPERAVWEAPPRGLELAARFGDDAVFRVTLAPTGDWRRALLAPADGRAPSGLPLDPLPAAARVGRLEAADLPATMIPGTELRLRVTNGGSAPWPGLGPVETGLVAVQAAWEPLAPGGTAGPPQTVPLGRDLAAGASLDLTIPLRLPSPGRWRVTLRLVQAPDDAFPAGAAPPLTWETTVRAPHA